ncbi:MAG: adenine deaminase [Elusimicrobiales bacterium]|nr:adenine deaminase [Elusimicrobiales bacterium]
MDKNLQSEECLKDFICTARGEKPADILLKNAKIVNVFSGEIVEDSVAVYKGRIIGFGEYEAKETIDLKGKYLMPGFIDAHVHIESSMVSVPEFARALLPCGTTSVVADPHEIANVLGTKGIKYILDSSGEANLGVYVMLPSCVPSTPLETSGYALEAEDLKDLINDPRVLGMGEMMSYPAVIYGDKGTMGKINLTYGTKQGQKQIDGHAPGLEGKNLNAYVAAGIKSDHECTNVQEALMKIRAGMCVMIREGTAAKNLKNLLPAVNSKNSKYFLFCTDDRHLEDIASEGHINYAVGTAIKSGIDPVEAIRMSTKNTAEYFGLRNLGAIAPGYQADMIVSSSLEDIKPDMVFKKGLLVAENGKIAAGMIKDYGEKLPLSMNVKGISEESFRLKAAGGRAKVIELIPHELITKTLIADIKQENGYVVADTDKDVLHISVIERHHATGNVSKGLVKGFGLKKGAIASSVSHDSHDIVVVGTNAEDMYAAAAAIIKAGGGIAAACDGKIIECLELPIAGLMSYQKADFVREKVKSLYAAAEKLGASMPDPYMAMAFLSLPPIPEIRITDHGVIDAVNFKVMDIFC